LKLLVSVSDAIDAAAALEGGADIIDAKNPASGALGAVTLDVFRDIHAVVASARPLTAALGDAVDERAIARTADAYARAGARLVKIGFAGITSGTHVVSLVAAARDGAAGTRAGVIATAYADADRVPSLNPFAMIDAAALAGATGILLDTADKQGPGLPGLMSSETLSSWVSAARDARLLVALAGKLTADDFRFANDAGADIIGVRGAACDSGRTGQIVAARVRALRSAVARRSTPGLVPDPVSASE
jgi:(5-formylfuran-3-yl)methyl phosphate synthase